MYGRGGAGNINQAKESSKKAAEDIEAQLPSAAPSSRPSPSSNASQDYAHMGRGGAGNWYQPSELSKEGTFTQPGDATATPTAAKPQVSTPWHPEGQELPVARSGRGGAGNFVWRSEDQAKKLREEEERLKEVVSQSVERDVEAGLAKPPGVVLGREVERGV
ncbi:hypothetical protein T440DRAFT_433843 [Plenodomus tracheiphilus IPT5]|uniref:Uncharacterized protein n=1 Tax=Plenodomus tracheiphilus IPT5 TaxID=1408161 RepID=A0A6A7AUP6_9PLEO|nr:hypothetical protein T440DRAFT_433843 [Plenodomus tracheiphilus IPT5]